MPTTSAAGLATISEAAFVPGDLVFFAERTDGREVHCGRIVVACREGVLTLALPGRTRALDTRAGSFVRAWLVEHAPRPMEEYEALAFSERRLSELMGRPLVVVHPDDEPPARRAHGAPRAAAAP